MPTIKPMKKRTRKLRIIDLQKDIHSYSEQILAYLLPVVNSLLLTLSKKCVIIIGKEVTGGLALTAVGADPCGTSEFVHKVRELSHCRD